MTGKILIIDDNEDVLLALNLLLEPYVEKIKVTTSPEKIGYFMDTYFPDVILLDMNFSRDASNGQEGLDWLAKILQKILRQLFYSSPPMQIPKRQSRLYGRVPLILSPSPGKKKNCWPL